MKEFLEIFWAIFWRYVVSMTLLALLIFGFFYLIQDFSGWAKTISGLLFCGTVRELSRVFSHGRG